MTKANEVLTFWFEELSIQDWYKKNPDLDNQIRERFGVTHEKATMGELFHWRSTHEGRVAEIIVLDQFSRNLFRDDPRAFAFDGIALVLAQEAVSVGTLEHVPDLYKQHILLPFMHSESLLVHEQTLPLYEKYNLNPEYEIKHKVIIEKWGRYPHRNAVLGRESTPEEIEFLKQPGSTF